VLIGSLIIVVEYLDHDDVLDIVLDDGTNNVEENDFN
jgi:hypothetical protein